MTLEELKELFFGDKPNPEDSQFYEWAVLKRELNSNENFPRPKRRQIWWCVIGKNVGHEQSCTEGFERPIIVIKTFGSTFWGLPITSSDPNGKKETNPLYFKLEETEYTNESGEVKKIHGFVALHQLRIYDNRRLKRRISKMEVERFDSILDKFRRLI